MQREYNYKDVWLKPQKCVINSRSEADITVKLGNHTFRNPVVLANMPAVVDSKTCKYLAEQNMFYIMHRFISMDEQIMFVLNMVNDGHIASISVGVRDEDKRLLEELNKHQYQKAVPHFITIDIAHGHSDRVADMIQCIKSMMPETFVIAGNVATAEAVQFLEEAGADACKIFVGPGAACTTKVKTGFTRGTVTCLQECVAVAQKPIIADGGISEAGHIAVAMACGAAMVMSGIFMCGFDQNAGNRIQFDGPNGKEYKMLYYGSASYNNKQNNTHVEGTEKIIDYKGDMSQHIYDIECSLKSAVSYAGVDSIYDMYGTPMFIMET